MSTPAQPWLARGAFVAAAAALAVMLGFAGVKSIAVLAVAAAGTVVLIAGLYWFLATQGMARWLWLVVATLAPIAVVVLFVRSNLLIVVLVSFGLVALGISAGTAALVADQRTTAMRTYEVPRPSRPYLIMNPYSGGGKVKRFGLEERAEALGAEVALIEGPERVDVAALARAAIERGVDLLGVAGGDGTQALVAAVAAEHDLPFVVISAGTRNHFALDLGLDREHPIRCLDALVDGVELRVDLGRANGRTFVNNISFGAYAEIVQNKDYRAGKTQTVTAMLPEVLAGRRGAHLRVHAEGGPIDNPQAVLVSNNVYGTADVAGFGRRGRLDEGLLLVIAVSVRSARQAVGLLRRSHERGLARYSSTAVTVDADAAEIPVGLDGEALLMTTPIQCDIRKQVLRVRVPRNRPGVSRQRPSMDWARLRQLAFSRTRPRAGPSPRGVPSQSAGRSPS
jgi:diacylglycerol kinase family enzyme